MNEEYAYKLVRRDDSFLSQRMSIFMDGTPRTLYGTHRFSRAPAHMAKAGYHLLVFCELEYAEQFRRLFVPIDPTIEIWLVKCREIVPLPQRLRTEFLNKPYKVVPSNAFCTSMEWPPGTQMWKEVKLVRQVM